MINGQAVGRANQTFFIPEKIRRLRLSELPLSTELASVLRKLNVSKLDDLSGISLHDFQCVSAYGKALFLKTARFVERARRGELVVAPIRDAGVNTLSSPRVAAPSLRVISKKERPHEQALLETSADEKIFIPVDGRGTLLTTFSVSVRLRHVFEFKHFRLFGDLHGLSFSEIRGYRNCGKKTVDELRDLVHAVQHSHQVPVAKGQASLVVQESPAGLSGGEIFVPANLHDLNVDDLPVSVRLEGVLQRRGVRRLGDVHGVSIQDLRRIENCGTKTISELVRVIELAEAGEFTTGADVPWNAADLVRTLDMVVAKLPDRNKEVLVLRLGGAGDEVLTLEEVGKKFCLTRERVRQIVERSVEHIRKHGGQRLRNYVEHVERICCEKVCAFISIFVAAPSFRRESA